MHFNCAPFYSVCTLVFVGFTVAAAKQKYADDPRTMMRTASLSPDGKLDIAAKKASLIEDGHVDKPKEVKPSPQITGTAFQAEQEMIDAAKKESENSDSALTNAKLMAAAAIRKAEDIKQIAKGRVVATLSEAKKDMKTGLEKSMASMSAATMSKTTSLEAAKKKVQAVMLALKTSKTSDEIIVANEKAETACNDALELANKTMKDLQAMSDSMHAEAAHVKTVADKAGEDIENKLTDATKDIEDVANQLAEVGLAVSTKMQAKADADEIELLVTKTAENIKATADKLVVEARETVTTVRSSGQEIFEKIISDAANAKADGDDIAFKLADSTNTAMQDIAAAKAAWLSADVDAMGSMSKKVSPIDESMLPPPKPKLDVPAPTSENAWYTKFLYLSVMLAILTLTGGVVFHSFQTKASS